MPEAFELRRALRSLARSPFFFLTTALTLALGIGAATAIFGVVDAVLLRPLPYPDAGRLVVPYHTLSGLGIPFAGQSRGTYYHYRHTTRSLQSIAGYRIVSVNLADASGAGAAERVNAADVSANFLPTLGVSPALGRNFMAAEDVPNGTRVALIGDGLWRRRFGGDHAVLERTIRVDGGSYRVIGVMPPAFHFPDAKTELWLPIRLDSAAPNAESFNIAAIARLAPGATIGDAERELNAQLERLPEAYPNIYPGMPTRAVLTQAKARAVVESLRDRVVGDFVRVLWIIAGTVGLVLIVTCANAGNLLLVRAEGRSREIAVRSALGATRWRLLGHFAAEGTLLAISGGIVGLGLAFALTRLLLQAGPATLPRRSEIGMDATSFAFAFLVTTGVALVCSMLPALRHRSLRVGAMLREGGRGGTAGRDRHRVQRTLITLQVALALLVLAGSALLARTVWKLRNIRPGFEPSHTLAFTVSLPSAQVAQPFGVAQFYREAVQTLRMLPGVEDVGVVSKLPLVGGSPLAPVYVEQFPVTGNALPAVFPTPVATAGYFHAMHIPLLAGRLMAEDYAPEAPSEVLVSRAFAEHYWHDSTGARALGQRLRVSLSESAPWSTIVGVVESVRDTALAAPPIAEVYFPLRVPAPGTPDSLAPLAPRVMNIVIRTAGHPLDVAAVARRTMRAMNATIPIYDVQPMTDVLDHATARTRFALLALAVAAVITLALGAVGLYGVIAYVVSLRTRELGLRMALGAQQSAVLGLVLRDAIGLALVGILAGLVAFAGVGRFLRGLLVGIAPDDPPTLFAVTAVVLLVATIASWLPARRAARIDPQEALRAD